MITSKKKKKHFNIHSWFFFKNLSNIGIKKNFLNLIKVIFGKPIKSINSERLNDSPLRSKTRWRCLLSTLFLNIILLILVSIIRWEREIKRIPVKEKEGKLSESTVDMTIYVKITWTIQKTLQNEYVNLAMFQDSTSIYKINCIHIYQQ